jgi:hypothetical protein
MASLGVRSSASGCGWTRRWQHPPISLPPRASGEGRGALGGLRRSMRSICRRGFDACEEKTMRGWRRCGNISGRLRQNPQTCDIPIIALSAHALAGERDKAIAAGCDEFDTKPIEFDRLVATVQRIVARRK